MKPYKVLYFNAINIMKRIIAILIIISATISNNINAQEIVKKFLRNQETTHKNELIYITYDDKIELINDNINQMIGLESLDEETQKQLKDKYTKLIDKIKAEEVLKIYKKGLVKELRRYGFTVYQQKYLVNKITGRYNTLNVSQIEIEEFTKTDSIKWKYYTDSTVYYKPVTGLRLNVWLEYNWADTTSRKLLFVSHEITDEFLGFTEEVEGTVYADYTYEPLTPNDAYTLSNNVSALTARYMYNFLLNKYVQQRTKGNHPYYYTIGENKKIKYSLYNTDAFEILPIE